MSTWGFAPRVSRMTFSASDTYSTLESGAALRIWGFIVANTSTGSTTSIQIEAADGSETYYFWTVAANDCSVSEIKFIADRGIRAKATGANFADLNIIWFHSQPGS